MRERKECTVCTNQKEEIRLNCIPSHVPEILKIILDIIGQGLCIGCGTTAATENVLGELRNLVGDTVGYVASCGDATIGTHNDTIGHWNSHDGCARGHFSFLQSRIVRVSSTHLMALLPSLVTRDHVVV